MKPRKKSPIVEPAPFPKLFDRSSRTMRAITRQANGMKKRINHQPGRPTIFSFPGLS
jgi:hypothetical protein